MDYKLPTREEVIEHMGAACAYKKYIISFKPTERTVVNMKLTHGPLKFRGVTYEKAKRKYSLQFVEIHNNEPKVISEEPCESIVDAIDDFIKQIDFCCKMHGRVQKIVCEWVNN